MKTKTIAPLALVFCLGGFELRASVQYVFSDSPSGVQVTYSGSLNTADLESQGSLSDTRIDIITSGMGSRPYELENFQPSPLVPLSGVSEIFDANQISYNWNLATTPSSISASSGYGETFGFYFFTFTDTTWLNLPYEYVSGAPIDGGMLFGGKTLSSMGLKSGNSFEVFLPDNEVISATVVPEQSPGALLAIGLLGIFGVHRFRFKGKAA